MGVDRTGPGCVSRAPPRALQVRPCLCMCIWGEECLWGPLPELGWPQGHRWADVTQQDKNLLMCVCAFVRDVIMGMCMCVCAYM